MKTFTVNDGVDSFQTGGPNGLIVVRKGAPLATDDAAVISILETDGAHAVTGSDTPAPKNPEKSPDKKQAAGGEQS